MSVQIAASNRPYGHERPRPSPFGATARGCRANHRADVFCLSAKVCGPRLPSLTQPSLARYIQCRYMATLTQIAKWGNSLALRLPRSVALEVRLDEGDTVDVSVKNGAIVISPSRPTYSLEQLVAQITPRNRHEESEWGAAVGHEVW